MSRHLVRTVCVLLALSAGPGRAAAGGTPSAREILRRAREVQQRPRDYVTEIKATFDIPNVRIVPMRVKLSYRRPDQIHFDTIDGFAMLPRQGIMPWSEELEKSLTQNAKMVVAGQTRIYSQPAYLIEITPKPGAPAQPAMPAPRGPFRRRFHPGPAAPAPTPTPPSTMRVWVERGRWLIRKMAAVSGPSRGELRFDYQQVAGKYWLPKRVVAKAQWTGQPMNANLPGQRKSMPMPSRATVTFDFSNYRVNVGLPASLFKPTAHAPAPSRHDPDEAR